jgi:glutaryl-CoA dehydrogenase
VSYQGVDFYRIEELLSPEEILVRNTVDSFVREEFLPLIEDSFEEATFPLEIVPRLGELGLFGIKMQGYGGAGMNNVCYGLACMELERGDTGLRSFISVQNSLVMYPIYTFGSDEQKERWLPRLAGGEAIGCFGLTEPDHGSDPGGMKTKAKKVGDDYVINGSKMWITNGSVADVSVIWAKTDDGIRGFLLEKETEGFTSSEIKKKLSMRSSVTSELFFDEVVVPKANMLPGAQGLRAPLMCLDEARYGISWGAVGAAMACYEAALDYAKSRIQFGRPIAAFQLTQRKLVKMLSEITKAQLLSLQLGRMRDEGKATYREVSLAKMNNAEEALKIAREARSILGANGISLEYPVIRHMNNLESVYTYEGTNEIHTLILGLEITGMNAFRGEPPADA